MEVDNDISPEPAYHWTRPGASIKEQEVDSDKALYDRGSPPHAADRTPIIPMPLSLHLRDDSVNCVCPANRPRLGRDMVMTVNMGTTISWTHLSCEPYSAENAVRESIALPTAGELPFEGSMASGVDGCGNGGNAGQHPVEKLAGLLGPNPTPEQLRMVENFTSTFRCDGPCPSKSKTLSDFFLCKKCLSWQNRDCQLYGDARDRGGPVCNQCFMDFVVHHDEIDKWQRRQLIRAVQAAVKYLNDPHTMHQIWRRQWNRDFVQRFLAKNRDNFVSFLVKRRRQQSHDRPQQDPLLAPLDDTPIRKRPKRKSTARVTGTDIVNDLDSVEEKTFLASDDDIIVTSRARAKPKPRYAKKQPFDRKLPATWSSSKSLRNRKRSATPPSSKKLLRGPRKSIRPSHHLSQTKPYRDEDTEEDSPSLRAIESERTPSPGHRRAPISPPRIACSCFSSRLATTADSFQCNVCSMWQHKRCSKVSNSGPHSICNFCLNRSSPPILPQPAPAPPKQTAEKLRSKPKPQPVSPLPSQASLPHITLAPALAGEVRTIASTILWPEYTAILAPDDDDDALSTQPSSPPRAWLREMEARLSILLSSAGKEQMAIYLNPVLSVFPREADDVVQALRDLAAWIVSKGALRGRRKELGVLLEVLGLDDKGTHWRGPGL